MAEAEKQKSPLQFLACPQCSGGGIFDKKDCPECQGLGLVAWTGSDLLYWGKKINFLQITQDQTAKIVKNIINLALFLFGALGLVMAGWVLLAFVNSNYPLLKFFQIRNWQLFIFWLSLLTDGYLFYRFQKELEKIKHIPRQKYETQSQIFQPLAWEESKKITRDRKINITDYFTSEAQETINKSWQLTNKYEDAFTNPIHLLVALLTFTQIQIIFSRLGVSFATLKSKIRNVLGLQLRQKISLPVILSNKVKEIIFQAYFLAYQLKKKKVEVTEILEALVSQENEVQELLYDLGITLDKVKNVAAWIRIRKQLQTNWRRFRAKAALRPHGAMNKAMTAIATPVLDAFSQDLTFLGQMGYLFPCIGRDQEIEEIFNIMHGQSRRSVILIGHPGVGRNTIAEGIALMMVEENVPSFLQDKRLVSLSIAKLVSGAAPTEAQERLLMALNEVRRSGNIILYIKDIHNMVGISAGRAGSLDLADVLAQALTNQNILALASSSPAEYRRYIEGKSSLDNALEKVNIKEVSGNEAIQILESKVGTFEYQNQIFFSYDAIAKTVELSNRYLHDRFLPEKAIEILQEVANRVKEQKGKNSFVTADDVALIISKKTNIPLAEITREESEKLLNLEEKIHQRIIDQEEAVEMVASSLRRARAEMRDLARPIANLLFLGPTGVGKTELAKTVAEVYFGAEENMIRLDMSEYQEKISLNRLIGAPPGYSGAGEGGYFTEAVRKNPFSLVLLDEIEKAHPDILNLFLQIMDDGRLTDNSGRTVDFTNTIIIMTSNAGTKFIQDLVKEGVAVPEIKQRLMDQELNQYFRPEFLNRFDSIIVFKPLTILEVQEITKLMLNKIKKNLETRGVDLKATPEAIAELAQAGFDPEFGARPLRRVIQQQVQDPLANYFLAGKISRRDTVIIETGNKITVQKAKII